MLLPCHGQPALFAPVNDAVTRIEDRQDGADGRKQPLVRTMATDKQPEQTSSLNRQAACRVRASCRRVFLAHALSDGGKEFQVRSAQLSSGCRAIWAVRRRLEGRQTIASGSTSQRGRPLARYVQLCPAEGRLVCLPGRSSSAGACWGSPGRCCGRVEPTRCWPARALSLPAPSQRRRCCPGPGALGLRWITLFTAFYRTPVHGVGLAKRTTRAAVH
jgi:hypothetical protein